MGGSNTYVYEAPKVEEDKSWEKYLQYQTNRENRLADRAEKLSSYERARDESRQEAAGRNLQSYYQNLEQQMQRGVIGFDDARSQLQNYITTYNLMTPGQTDVTDYEAQTQDTLPITTTTTTTENQALGQPGDEDYQPASTTTVTEEEVDTSFQPPAPIPNYEWDTDWDNWTNPQTFLSNLWTTYAGADVDDLTTPDIDESLGILGQQRLSGIERTYRDVLGRDPTETELSEDMHSLNTRAWDGAGIAGLRESLKSGDEYTRKFNTSYMENYYDSMYGPQTIDEDGNKTKKRKFTFDSTLLPGYSGDLASLTNVTIPDFDTYFDEARTVKELEEGTQNIRDTRKYLYSAGLTHLQGQIDSDIAKIKTEGQKDIAKIGADASLVGSMLSGIWNS